MGNDKEEGAVNGNILHQIGSGDATHKSGSNITVIAEIEGVERHLEYDFLCVAAPYRGLQSVFASLTPLETRLIDSLRSYTFTTTLYSARRNPRHRTGIAYWPNNLQKGSPMEGIVADRFSKMAINNNDGFEDDEQDRVAYQFCDRVLKAEEKEILLQGVRDHLRRTGAKNAKILEQSSWEYFPHYDLQGCRDRSIYKRLASQGMMNTWWVGSSACFESILDVCSYNHLLVDHLVQR